MNVIGLPSSSDICATLNQAFFFPSVAHSQTASPVDGFVRSTERATLHMTSARVTEIDKDGTAINAQPVKSKMELEREGAQNEYSKNRIV